MTTILHKNIDPSEPFDALQYAFRIGRSFYLRELAEDLRVLRAQAALAGISVGSMPKAESVKWHEPFLDPVEKLNWSVGEKPRTKIIVALLAKEGPMKASQIAARLGDNGRSITCALQHLRKTKRAFRNGEFGGRWHLPTQHEEAHS